jgi:serralysin
LLKFGKTVLPDGVAGWAYLPSGLGRPGDVWFDKEYFDAEFANPDGLFVVIHEMGHALGLTHPFMEDPFDFNNLPPPTENTRFTVMSYTNADGGARRNESPMLYDLVELQKDYGGNFNYNPGNTDIVLPLNYTSFRTIWDGGGTDTLNFDNQTSSITGDLREGRYSSLGGVTENVAIAYGALIENLRGGLGDDTLFGNEVNNIIVGNAGSDELTGFSGNDILRGGAGNDRYNYTLGDDFDTINEETFGGRDVLTIKGFGTFNSLTGDLSFRVLNGRDLDIQLTLDNGETQGGILIKNMAWGGSRIETLKIQDAMGMDIGPDIDLRSIFVYSTTELKTFRATEFTSEFGTLAVPV